MLKNEQSSLLLILINVCLNKPSQTDGLYEESSQGCICLCQDYMKEKKKEKKRLHVMLNIVTTDIINYITTNKTTKDKLSQEMFDTGCVLFLMVNGSFCP